MDKEKTLVFQMTGVDTIGISFQNFFDVDLKDIIKPLSISYDKDTKIWTVSLESRDKLVQEIY
jgi:hypothetical protein